MSDEKGTCPVEDFYRGIGRHVRLKVYNLIYHHTRDPHSCPAFCIRILKTKFVLPKLFPGSSSSPRSSASCCADLQLYNWHRSLLQTNI